MRDGSDQESAGRSPSEKRLPPEPGPRCGSLPPPPSTLPERASRGSRRRRFTAEYKLEILRRVESCSRPGEVGELLRDEGLYFSHLTNWRRQRDQGALEGLRAKKRGRKSRRSRSLEEWIAQLEARVCELEEYLVEAVGRANGEAELAASGGDSAKVDMHEAHAGSDAPPSSLQ